MKITDAISMKSVKELFGESFFIPNYQRGYRWERQQAEDLLNDIDAFIKKVPSEEEIYCLQPLVISEDNDKSHYRVIDGQQRLTTIYLILSYLKKTVDIYTIEYDTRKDSSEFLKNIADKAKDEEEKNKNVDFYHMALVYDTIKNWFKKHRGSDDDEKEFANVLLNKVKLICYNISKTGSGEVSLDDEIGVFNRLNIGKIPLTDSELIKAMFLNRNNYEKNAEIESRQNKLANEWYEIEKVLQNDEFWLFIHSRYYYRPTRIDYILDLMSRSDAFGILGNIGKDAYDNASDDEKTTMLANTAYPKWKNYYLGGIKEDIYGLVYNEDNTYTECGEKIKEYLLKGTQNKAGFDNLDINPKKERLKERFFVILRNNKEDEFKAEVGEDHYNNNIQPMIDKYSKEAVDYIGDMIYGLVYNEDNTYTECGETIKKFLLKDTTNQDGFDGLLEDEKKKKLKERFLNKIDNDNSKSFKTKKEEDNYYKNIQPIIDEFSKKLGEKLESILEKGKEEDKKEIYTALGEYIVNELTDDEHFIYRYFDKVFKDPNGKSSEELWKKVTDFFKIFTEWYNDYRLYHYIGYLAAVKGIDAEDFMGLCVKEWNNNKDRQAFINWLRAEIIEMIKKNSDKDSAYGKKFNYFRDLLDPKKKDVDADGKSFEEKLINTKFEENDYSKRCCVNILLLHNIETVIQYNDKLLNNAKYTAPYFSRFPFHLYNNERWDVEHVMPNANQINIEEERLIYILNAKEYYNEEIEKNDDLKNLINEYISLVDPKYIRLDYNKLEAKLTELKSATDDKKKAEREYYDKLKNEDQEGRFKKICEGIEAIGDQALGDDCKNNIWNYTLLDSSTNREYGNHIFPYKRAYIAKKEEGIKLCIGIVEGADVEGSDEKFHLEYRHENKNDIVKMINAYSKADAVLQGMIKDYINDIKNNKQRVYENTNGGAKDLKEKINAGIKDLVDKDLDPNKYMLVYLKNSDRGGNNDIQYKMVETYEEAPFVLQTTKNVFNKYYTEQVTTMLQWTKADAENYWNDMRTKLKYYFDELDKEMKDNIKNSKKKEGADKDE